LKVVKSFQENKFGDLFTEIPAFAGMTKVFIRRLAFLFLFDYQKATNKMLWLFEYLILF